MRPTVSDVSCIVSADAHAFDVVTVPENKNVPLLDADHAEMSVIVSDVPPFVQDGVPDIVTTPDDADPNVALERPVEPTETLAVPADPGAPVWIWK